MRARKRPRGASADDVPHRNDTINRGDGSPQDGREVRRSSSSRELDKDGYVQVELAEIRDKVQCPICLGIIRNTRAVKECLHRFCQECIAKYMLLSNECPACHAHCGSNSLRADPRYDALIEAFYPDFGKSKMASSFRPLSLEDAMRSKPLDTSTIPGVHSQSQLEGTTNAITQNPSIGVKTNSPFPPKTRKTEGHSSPGTLSKSSRNTPTKGTSKKYSTALPTVKEQKHERSAPTKCRRVVLALASSPTMELGRGTAVAQSSSADVMGAPVSVNDILVDKQEMSDAQIFGSADQDTVQVIDMTTITDTIIGANSGQEIITSVSIAASDILTDDHDHPQRMSKRRQDDEPVVSDSLVGSAIPSNTRSPPPLTAADYTPPSADSAAGNEPVERVLTGSAIAKGLATTTVNPSDPTLATRTEPAAVPSSASPPVQLGCSVPTSPITRFLAEVDRELKSLTDQYQVLSDNYPRLKEEVAVLKAQLADAEHRVTVNRQYMARLWQAIKEFGAYSSGLDYNRILYARNKAFKR